MEELSESFSKFKTFMNNLFIRGKKSGFNANDFNKDKFVYIQDNLEKLLPLLSIEDVQRIKIYFQNAYIFHLNNGLRIANIFPQRYLTPDPVAGFQYEVEQSFLVDDNAHSSELRNVDNSNLYSQPFVPENTLLKSFNPIQTENTRPLMQSTPLSIPLLPPEPVIGNVQHQDDDVFTTDIISQINISPIHLASATLRMPNVQPAPMSTSNVDLSEVPFLRNFANIERGELLREETLAQNTPRRPRKRPNVDTILREPKKKMDKVKFDAICCFSKKNKTDAQIKRSEESFLYFFLMRVKESNIINRVNTFIPQCEREHISKQKVINLTNILRAHASQIQSFVEQAVPISEVNSIRSTLTTQGLVQTSLPSTHLGGDNSGFETGNVAEQVTSFPTHSLQRQQPLLPIPERDSLIHMLQVQHDEIYINDPATLSNLPTENLNNVEMLEDQSLQNTQRNPSQNKPQQENVHFNNNDINDEPLIVQEPIFPRALVENQSSNIPRIISGDFEIMEQPQQSSDVLRLAQETETRKRLGSTTDVPTALPDFFQEQTPLIQVASMQLAQSITQDAVPVVDQENDNLPFNWFETLRPRNDFVEYPREILRNKRKRRRRRGRRRESPDEVVHPLRHHELPVIPRSPSPENINELTVNTVGVSDQIPQNPILINVEELNTPLQVEDSNQIIDNPKTLIIDLPENLLNSPSRISEVSNGISYQIRQYPRTNSQLKEYFELIKVAGRKLDYKNWDHFDSSLFNQNDCFELYTNIFKRIIKDNYVTMDSLYEHGTTRLEAAKGFRFILDLKAMGLLEIESVDTRIIGIRLSCEIYTQKL